MESRYDGEKKYSFHDLNSCQMLSASQYKYQISIITSALLNVGKSHLLIGGQPKLQNQQLQDCGRRKKYNWAPQSPLWVGNSSHYFLYFLNTFYYHFVRQTDNFLLFSIIDIITAYCISSWQHSTCPDPKSNRFHELFYFDKTSDVKYLDQYLLLLTQG